MRTKIQQRIVKWRGMRKAAELSRSVEPIKLDLGCGAAARAGFIGIDLFDTTDLCWDLRWGLPFADNTIAEIRSDHLLEHLELPEVVAVLSECYRVLRPGGILDFTVPHFDPYLEAYLRRDFDLLKERIHDFPKDQEWLYNTSFDLISWLLHRNGEHKSLFDKESILAKVRLVGFSQVNSREFEATRDINQRFSSVYVVGVK